MADRRCPYCGEPVAARSRYCDLCGTPLTADSTCASPTARRTRSVALWVFFIVVVAVFGTGTLGGYRYRTGQWPLVFADTRVAPAAVEVPSPKPRSQPDSGAVEGYLRSVVSVNARSEYGNRTGSGFVMDAQGHVVTAAHVVEGASGCVTITDDNGRTHQGLVVDRDLRVDVALLYVPTLQGFPTHLVVGQSARTKPGDEAYVLGSPKGVGNSVPLAATISRVGEDKTIDGRFYADLIQVGGATAMEGTSGGPLVERSTGDVVGIVVAGAGAPIAWAVPTDQVAGMLQQWASRPVSAACSSVPARKTIPVSLAAIVPLSGTFGVHGTDIADGAELALRDMEVALRQVGYDVTLKRYDDQGEPERAREMADLAAYDPNVVGVVGSLDNQVTGAVAQQLSATSLVLLAPTAGAESLTANGWTHVNRIVANTQRQEQAAARFAQNRLQARSVFILDEGTPDSARQAQNFSTAAQVIALTVAGRVQISSGTDYKDLRHQIGAAKADVIYYAGRSAAAAKVIRGLREDGLTLPILGGQSLFDPVMETLMGSGAEGIFFTRLTAEPTEQFQRHFEDVLGKPTRGYAAYGYDAASVILSALVRYGESHPATIPSRSEFAKLVRSTRGHQGWTSWVTFDGVGDNETSWVFLFEWKHGTPELRENLKYR